MTKPYEIELSTGKVAGCACIGAQLATVAGQCLTNGATTPATDPQLTTLKAVSLLILQRNSQRNQDATKNDGLWITQQKQRNFDPENTVEKLRPVAPVAGRLRDELRAEILSADPIAEAAHAHGLTPEQLRADQERSAIREFDGGQSRADAEESAEVYCRDCAHWTADSLNPDMGLGECAIRPAGTLPLPWPGATCRKNQLQLKDANHEP